MPYEVKYNYESNVKSFKYVLKRNFKNKVKGGFQPRTNDGSINCMSFSLYKLFFQILDKKKLAE